MGLLDIFKKKPEQPTSEKLSLEELLKRAASEPAYRLEFYTRLLSDELVVITENSGLPNGDQTLEKDTTINIVSFPENKIPIFTSTERIFDKGIIKGDIHYMAIKGADIFKMMKGATFLLNPYSDYGKELLPNEIEGMLSGEIITRASKTITLERQTKYLIGQPKKYPTEIVNSLKVLFSNRPNVSAAYLGVVSEEGKIPHLIFGIDGKDLKDVMTEAGFTVKEFLAKDEVVDFVNADMRNELFTYLKTTSPFYKK